MSRFITRETTFTRVRTNSEPFIISTNWRSDKIRSNYKPERFGIPPIPCKHWKRSCFCMDRAIEDCVWNDIASIILLTWSIHPSQTIKQACPVPCKSLKNKDRTVHSSVYTGRTVQVVERFRTRPDLCKRSLRGLEIGVETLALHASLPMYWIFVLANFP